MQEFGIHHGDSMPGPRHSLEAPRGLAAPALGPAGVPTELRKSKTARLIDLLGHRQCAAGGWTFRRIALKRLRASLDTKPNA